MRARIVSYRRGRKTVTQNQAVVDLGAKNKQEANKLLGTRVVYHTMNKALYGVVSRVHGNIGKVIARFRTGLPGQAIGRDVEVLGKPKKAETKTPKKSK